ncbi:MAG: rhodanese-like domain-containing protein [Pirellulales bacterium]
MAVQTISAAEFATLVQSGQSLEVFDVRTPSEYRELHLELARNVPLTDLEPAAAWKSRRHSSDAPLYIVCQSGMRGREACERFQRAGFENVVNVEGGTKACEALGLPVRRGRKSISLERQVRIAAGMLVLVGVVLGTWVHPWLYGLSAFVGAGLVFAGVTDTCGMALLLARLPWNRA